VTETRWWQRGIVYQVYPRSFCDSNGDGVGDLRGIQRRLDHLEWLGVDAVWISPIYPSPMADFGYDVADYTDVEPLFGSLAELDALMDDLHRRGMRLVLDFVPNHTSNAHPWFRDARSSRAAMHRDWYIWRDPASDGGPPNDWQSVFGGPAWEWDEQTGQFYFHSFLAEQPDLDWTNPQVHAAMDDVMRFWLRRGVDGFRIDVLALLAKGPELVPLAPDQPRAIERTPPDYERDQPEIHELVRHIRGVADEFDDRLLIGEIYQEPEGLVRYYGENGAGIHLPFNFQLLLVPWQAERIHATIRRYEQLMPAYGWPNWVLSNHDHSRVASRVGAAQARVAAVLLLTLRGTPTLYYGDEIGMGDVDIPSEAIRDPQGLRGGLARDVARTPMRWDGTPTAGFTSGEPWLPIGPSVGEINVETERDDPGSMLTLYRRLIRLRRAEQALHAGPWRDLGTAGSAIAYLRGGGDRKFLVCVNLANEAADLPARARGMPGRVAIATPSLDREGTRFESLARLEPNEGLVVLLD
jgi:alpha-glucosidase